MEDSSLRMAVFFGGLFVLMLLERAFPRRLEDAQRRLRWPANLGLVALSAALLALLPLAAIGTALWAEARGWGLLNQWPLPVWAAVPLAWLLLDAAIYAQHRAMHQFPLLWRLHRVHHSDVVFDVTTGVRFHPVEIGLSMLWKMAVVLALGAPPLAVLLLEITLNGLALFNHANLRVPGDRWLRRLLVTPDMHRVHHSIHRDETDSNYGSALSLWDHLFGSYRAQPRDGHAAMRIGIPEFRDLPAQRLPALLTQPRHRV